MKLILPLAALAAGLLAAIEPGTPVYRFDEVKSKVLRSPGGDDSRAARVIVEADYRMKLIGIGKLEPVAGIPDYFDLLAQNPHTYWPVLKTLLWYRAGMIEGSWPRSRSKPRGRILSARGTWVSLLLIGPDYITAPRPPGPAGGGPGGQHRRR